MIEIPVELLEEIERGDVTLFVGERLNRDIEGNVAVDRLTAELVARCGLREEDSLTFPQAAQAYEYNRSRHALVQFMRDQIEALGDEPQPVHHLIASLEQIEVLVTTSLTDRLERAFEAAKRPYEVVMGDVGVTLRRGDKVTIYKLRGSLDRPESLILTQPDHARFFRQHSNLRNMLKSYLASKTILFVGYDLEDPLFQRLYQEVTDPADDFRRPAYAFGEAPSPRASLWCRQYNVQVVPVDTTDFLEDLIEQLAGRRPPNKSRPTEIQKQKQVAPFEAPPHISLFVGRETDLAEFCELIAHAPEQNIYCLVGMAGIGKTAFAQRAAHVLRPYFSDGVLWARVATEEPLAILDRWAHAYGADHSNLPNLERRVAELRRLLTDKRILIILDDVRDREQVQPFLVGGPRSIFLLTTRSRSVAVDVSQHEYIRSLSALAHQESRELMVRILGEKRVSNEVDAADQICQLLGHLPLAVEIAAKKLAVDPSMPLDHMLAWLRDEKGQTQTRNLLNPEVRASFASSWRALDEDMRRSFALLAVFGGRAITADAFAPVAQMDKWPAQSRLTAFVALSLLTGEGQGRYRQHPLLVEFALERLVELTAQRPQDREEAYARMVCYYLAYAVEHQQDYADLEQDWDNLLAGMKEAYRRGMWPEVIGYAEALTDVWFAWGHFSEARQGYEWACDAARALADRQALAASLQQWGRACIEQGDYSEAEELLSASLQIFQELEDRLGVAGAQSRLGRLFYDKADYEAAQQVLTQAQRTFEEAGDERNTADVLYLQAMIQYDHDELEKAEHLGQTALALQQALDDKAGEMRTLTLLGEVAYDQGRYDFAIEKCEAALALGSQIQDKSETAATLYTLCKVLRRKGEALSALEKGRASLALSKQVGDRRGQAQTLSLLSEIHLDLGQASTALSQAAQSLELCDELGDSWGVVWVLYHMGRVHLALNQPADSHQVWAKALKIATSLEHPLCKSLVERLAETHSGQ